MRDRFCRAVRYKQQLARERMHARLAKPYTCTIEIKNRGWSSGQCTQRKKNSGKQGPAYALGWYRAIFWPPTRSNDWLTCIEVKIEGIGSVKNQSSHQPIIFLQCIKPCQLTTHLLACAVKRIERVRLQQYVTVVVVTLHQGTFTVVMDIVCNAKIVR